MYYMLGMYYIPKVKQDLEQSGENIPTRPSSELHAWLHVFSNNEIFQKVPAMAEAGN